MSYMADTMHLNEQVMTPNRDAAYMVITLGYVIENNTLVNEIHKLVAGHYLAITNGKFQEIQYHRFSNTPVERSKEEMIEEIDCRFRNAVRLQFEKDTEYGYKHVAGLSGGLDSRMTVWVAHELGYQRQLNMTFCQSNYTDFKVAQQIATDLGHDFIFKALDGGNCIFTIDDVSRITYGLACFFGLAHGKSLFDNFNYSLYGMVHTGMLGDIIIGSYLENQNYNIQPQLTYGAYSVEKLDRLADFRLKYNYDNVEIYMIYNRGFGFCGQGTLTYDHCQTENYSPFCDVEFMEYCLSIPLEWRCGHKIYKEWILSKYPDAADYIWERIGKTIKDSLVDDLKKPIVRHTMNIAGKEIPTPRDPYFGAYVKGFILRRLGIRKKVGKKNIIEEDSSKHTFMLDTKENMNPVDYWYYGNPKLRKFMDEYWTKNSGVIKDKQLLADMTYLYMDCKATYDKLQPLTLLSAYKLLFL
jgi:asparagine synthase (glutamine-hydrolysing)